MKSGIRIETRKIASSGRDIRLLILRPGLTGCAKCSNGEAPENSNIEATAAGSPGVLWIHGGGYVTGFPEMVFMTRALDLARKHNAVVVSPGYRLAGEAPYPAALEDCFAALMYMKEHAEELGIRSDQIMVGGESAGGGLTAALCLYARDQKRKGMPSAEIAYQMPLYPMLDDRDTESSRDNHAPVWNTKRNHAAWEKYLRGIDREKTPFYAAAARAEDYSDLPPAYTFVGDIEPFYCETVQFVENLKMAGVEAELDIYPGCFHAFDMMLPFLKISKKAAARFEEKFEYAKVHYFREQTEETLLKLFRRV